MSTHNIGFYEDLTKIIFQLSSIIIKYAPYFFCCDEGHIGLFIYNKSTNYTTLRSLFLLNKSNTILLYVIGEFFMCPHVLVRQLLCPGTIFVMFLYCIVGEMY